jgi:hypothetical protein
MDEVSDSDDDMEELLGIEESLARKREGGEEDDSKEREEDLRTDV